MNQNRLVVSSVSHLATLLSSYPDLININAFKPIAPLLTQLKAQSCNCNKNKLYQSYKGYFEAALTNLTPNDITRIKEVLKVSQICYYVKSKTGVLDLTCL